jgi:CRP-like cAMP-binding protein
MNKMEVPAEKLSSCSTCSVRRFALYKDIPLDSLSWLQGMRSGQYRLSPKQSLYTEGNLSREVFTLFSGMALVFRILPEGKRQILRILLPGDFLGFQVDLDQPMDHSVIAASECVFCVFPKENIRRMIREIPELTMRMMELQSESVIDCHDWIASIGQKTAIQRVAQLFLMVYLRIRERGAVQDSSVIFPLTQHDIADAVGVTPVHVSRVASELRKEQIADCKQGRLYVYNLQQLADIASVKLDNTTGVYRWR